MDCKPQNSQQRYYQKTYKVVAKQKYEENKEEIKKKCQEYR